MFKRLRAGNSGLRRPPASSSRIASSGNPCEPQTHDGGVNRDGFHRLHCPTRAPAPTPAAAAALAAGIADDQDGGSSHKSCRSVLAAELNAAGCSAGRVPATKRSRMSKSPHKARRYLRADDQPVQPYAGAVLLQKPPEHARSNSRRICGRSPAEQCKNIASSNHVGKMIPTEQPRLRLHPAARLPAAPSSAPASSSRRARRRR